MICPRQFVESLRERGIRLVTGVPCSYLTGLINTAIDHSAVEYIGASNEGEAVAIACGAELGGIRSPGELAAGTILRDFSSSTHLRRRDFSSVFTSKFSKQGAEHEEHR